MKRPTATAANPATLALVLAASASVAPIRFAMRVEAAMEMGKGILGCGFGISVASVRRGGRRGGVSSSLEICYEKESSRHIFGDSRFGPSEGLWIWKARTGM